MTKTSEHALRSLRIGLFAALLTVGLGAPAAFGASSPDEPKVKSRTKVQRSTSSSASRRASSARSGSSQARSGETSSRASSARRSSSTSRPSVERDRRDTSDWKGYDHYRRYSGSSSHRPYRHPRHRSYYYGGSYFYWGPWGYHPWGYRPYDYYYGPTVRVYSERPGAEFGALDLDVSPADTEVFIDGGYVGTVDDFDGWPTYLWLEEGTYDVVLFAEGYRTIYRQYTIRPGLVIDVGDALQPGLSERPEDVMTPDSTKYRDRRLAREEERQAEARREAELEQREERFREAEEQDELGRLSFRVWPGDAAVYLDGHFVGTAYELEQLSAGLLVAAGEHEIEILRPGHETWTGDPYVEAGELTEIEVELDQD